MERLFSQNFCKIFPLEARISQNNAQCEKWYFLKKVAFNVTNMLW